jgi:perosamine synthetase
MPIGLDRDGVRAALASRGIETGRYFPPIHLQPACRTGNSTVALLPVTESIAPRMLALPFFNRITATQQQEVAEVLGDAILSLRISSEAGARSA